MAGADQASDFYNIVSILSGDTRDYLVLNNGDEVKIESLNTPILGLYFSASWCPHCKAFTRQITKVFNNITSENKGFEMVLISLDWSEEGFNCHFSSMPWLAVPFSDWETRQRLSELFKITGVPTLVILDGESGRLVSDRAAELVAEHGGRAYPFTEERIEEIRFEEERMRRNQTLRSLLGSPERDFVLSSKGNKVPIAELEGNVVGLYFSLNSSNQFASTLSQLREKIRAKDENFEIVTVPISDNEQSNFMKIFSAMPSSLTIPFKDKSIDFLIEYFEVSDFPTLVMIGSDGKTLNCNAAEIVENYGVDAAEWFPFSEEKLTIMNEMERSKTESQTLESLLISGDLDYVVGNGRRKVPVLDLVGKTILLYFSAEWSRSCREFQQKLIGYYNEIKAEKSSFEIVFISSDRDINSYVNFSSSMPWLTLPFEDPRKNSLHKTFRIKSLPSVVVIGLDGKSVSEYGKQLLLTYGADAFPFTKERIEELIIRRSSMRSEVNFTELAKKGEEKSAFDLIDKFASMIPDRLQHELHEEHELVLAKLSNGERYSCYECELFCERWSYRCDECEFDLHPLCALDSIE